MSYIFNKDFIVVLRTKILKCAGLNSKVDSVPASSESELE